MLTALVAPSEGKDKQNRVVQFSSRYRLAFSLLNEDASAGNAVMAWNVQKGIQGESHVESVAHI
jgi:phosphatidylinositol glycan class S